VLMVAAVLSSRNDWALRLPSPNCVGRRGNFPPPAAPMETLHLQVGIQDGQVTRPVLFFLMQHCQNAEKDTPGPNLTYPLGECVPGEPYLSI